MKIVMSLTIACLLALALPVMPAAAAPPLAVTIISHMNTATLSGDFVATGAAEDAGLICPEGDVYDIEAHAAGFQSGRFVNIFVHKHFVCSDGSGQFEMNLNVRIVSSVVTARWLVVPGDGSYERLHGRGTLSATVIDEDNLIDTYSGNLLNQ